MAVVTHGHCGVSLFFSSHAPFIAAPDKKENFLLNLLIALIDLKNKS